MDSNWDELKKRLNSWREANSKALENPINPRIASSLKQEISCLSRVLTEIKNLEKMRPLVTNLGALLKENANVGDGNDLPKEGRAGAGKKEV